MSVNLFDGKIISAVASEAITKNRFVKLTGSTLGAYLCDIADTAERPDGIACETVASGGVVPIAIDGRGWLQIEAGQTILQGSLVKPDSNSTGMGIVASSDHDFYGAIADVASTNTSVSGETLPVVIKSGFISA